MTSISLIAKQYIIETDVTVETMYDSRIGVRIINNLIINVGDGISSLPVSGRSRYATMSCLLIWWNGRHDRFRIYCLTACRFDSCYQHWQTKWPVACHLSIITVTSTNKIPVKSLVYMIMILHIYT